MASFLVITLLALFETAFSARIHRVLASPDIPITSFSCQDRPIGYYADVETNCQVYHMCGEGGRQYSYTCPNTTLFHQRMLICAHWYQVNCNRSMADYSANLLIGQRDKPFVEDYIASNLGDDLQELEPLYYRNSKSLKFPNKSINKIEPAKTNFDLSGSSQDNVDNSDLVRSPSASLASHSFNSRNRLTTLRNQGLNYKGAVAVKPTPVTEPTGTVKFRPTNVSFRSTIETPNSEAVLARTAPMTSAQPAHRTEPAFKQIDATTPRNQPIEPPSRNLLPPLLSDIDQTNTIELRLEDPRRVLYIPKVKNGDNKNSEPTPDDKPIVVTINLKGQTGFRSSAVDKQKITQCSRCHPAFVIDKKNCTPCLLIS